MAKPPTLRSVIGAADPLQVTGRVRSVVGLSLRAALPGARLGETVWIERRAAEPLLAEVVGLSEDDALLLPVGELSGVAADDAVRPTGEPLGVPCSSALLGRVLDGLGRPVDGGPPLEGARVPLERAAPPPLDRPRITAPLATGIRVIDGLLPLGEGQRVGLFAGSGVGKSTLLGQIARQTDADVFVVALVGERGREVREFLEDSLGPAGLARGVVVVATSDAPALLRMKSALTATAIAEYFRDEGKRVLLLMDSVTRFARAAREVGLAAGEPPARRGYPPSVFAALPRLLERTGPAARGSISALYTVLVEGDDLEEPVADEVRGILDGHIVLSRALAERGRFPAVDSLASVSRVADAVAPPAALAHARRLRALLARYEEKRDLVLLGAYPGGTDPLLDEALARMPVIESFLAQAPHERTAPEDTASRLAALLGT